MLRSVMPPRLGLAQQIAVTQIGPRTAAQPEGDRRDDDPPPQRMFEDALAVAEGTMFPREDQRVACIRAKHLDALDRIFRLCAVSPDVLHRRRPDLARDEREVLDAPQVAFDGPRHQVVPLDARFGTHGHGVGRLGHGVGRLGHDVDRRGARGQQHTVEILREENVVAPRQHRPFRGRPLPEKGGQVVRRFELDEPRGPLPHVETVAAGEVDVIKIPNHIAKIGNFY